VVWPHIYAGIVTSSLHPDHLDVGLGSLQGLVYLTLTYRGSKLGVRDAIECRKSIQRVELSTVIW
jgi:hypothetical protein